LGSFVRNLSERDPFLTASHFGRDRKESLVVNVTGSESNNLLVRMPLFPAVKVNGDEAPVSNVKRKERRRKK